MFYCFLLLSVFCRILNPGKSLNNLASYNPSTNEYSSIETICNPSSCSIISLASDFDSGRIFVITMTTTAPYQTELYMYEGEWIQMTLPAGFTDVLLFDSLTLTNNSTLFAISHTQSDSLYSSFITYSLLSWDINNFGSEPSLVTLYQKSCSSTSDLVAYPSITKYSDTSIIAAVPYSSCPSSIIATAVDFNVYDIELNIIQSIPSINDANIVREIQVVSEDLIYFSNSTTLFVKSDDDEWNNILDDVNLVDIYYSSHKEYLYVTYNYNGFINYVEFFESVDRRHEVFVGEVYTQGEVLTITELNDDNRMIGGDFKYVGDDLLPAKFAAIWDGSKWKPTLDSNDDTYLTGWRLISASAIGDTVFAIADSGYDVTSLPLIRWREDDGWLFLYKRPVIIDNESYNPKYGTVYIDNSRNQVYFGGEFTVGTSSGESCTGAVIYHFLEERWSSLPANLTRVNSFASLNAHSYLQVGGSFTYTDENMVTHDNYLIVDVEQQTILNSVPSITDSEVFSISLFPDQAEYSYVGGIFGQHGVEQLRYSNPIWSLSVVGNTPLSSTVYSLAARNGGQTLFAGGSFAGGLSKLDIGRQDWSTMLPNAVNWYGNVKSLMITCPYDVDYYSYASAWDNSSDLESFYSAPECTIPPDAPEDFQCNPPLSTWAIIGLCFTVLITLIIVGVIGYFGYKTYKQQAKIDEDSVEYI